MTQHPTIARWKAHYTRCVQCRDALWSTELCPSGRPLRRAAIDALYAPRAPRRARIVAWGGLVLLCLVLLALIVACAPAAEPRLVAPELVRVIVQTERSIQLQHDDDRIEVADAPGWPLLSTPVVVCASFAGSDAASAPPRVARYWDREACRGALVPR